MRKVLYHAGCHDGFCAAWLYYQVFGESAQYIPVSYGKEPPVFLPTDEVYIVDFSYPAEILDRIRNRVCYLVVLDHHKTCPVDHPSVIFDNNCSGARITYDYLRKKFNYIIKPVTAHWLIDYTEDRDLWKWELPHSKEINAWLRSWPLIFETWDWLASKNPKNHLIEGTAILRAQDIAINIAAKQAELITFEGYDNVPCLNCTENASEIGNVLAKDSKHGFSITYRDRNGQRVYSLRSVGDFDVSVLARKNGGGGHKNAAGFLCSALKM